MAEPEAPTPSVRKKIVAALFVLWAISFAMSFVLLVVLAPTGDGFVRGMNTVVAFAAFQFAALVLAAVTLFVGLGQFREQSGWRWLSRAPLLGELLVTLVLGALIVRASIRAKPAAPVETAPPATTAP